MITVIKKSILLLLVLSCFHTDSKAQSIKADTFFQNLKYRNVGPFRGGRSVAASGVVDNQLVAYMGTTGGGLWKTDDAGQRWKNISDSYFKTGSVGAVAVSESNTNIVYCGMGEHAVRGVMTHHGDGMYKSTDGGKTWKRIGLEKTQHIAEIKIHPTNPDVVYVAAQGALYGYTEERGVYMTKDGGKTWDRILYINEKVGCTDLEMDMNNPLVLYAAMCEYGRKPWKVISGGPDNGLYKSTDGGETWNKVHDGLPKEKGKMAVSLCRAEPDRVYALLESDSDAEKGGLFVSDNGGTKWTRVSKDHRLVQRAWYYIEVFADPLDKDKVYVLSAPALYSIDGGKNWQRITGTHGDFHDLWIDPNNPRHLVIANDGGAAISFNRGKTWSVQDNMPTAQFYRVNVDNQFPYRIYGGQQDNSSVVISSLELNSYSIGERSWSYSAGGESAFLAFDPDNPRYVLGGSYLGTIEVLDTRAQAGTNIMAAPIQYLGRDAKDMKYRYNWNAPIIWSKHEPNTYYHAAQYLLRTRDMGKSWEEASPDLTRNEKDKQGKGGGPYTNEAVGAENYGTISYVAESPHEKGVIWVGSDDGLVHITRDGAQNWENVTPSSLEECLVNAIDISPHDPASAYIATTRYKFNDHTPAIYRTKDYGKTWKNISKGIPNGAFTRVVREDSGMKGLLFAGTETGIYISWNDGDLWESFQLNLPVTPITDLIVKHDDLIIATSGRSFWIFDDLELLRQYSGDASEVEFFNPAKSMLSNHGSELNSTKKDFKGTHTFKGINPANGVVLYYNLPKLEDSTEIVLEIRDQSGYLIRSLTSEKDKKAKRWDGGPPLPATLPKEMGLNRFVWDMRHGTRKGVPGVYIEGNYRGHKVGAGEYSLRLKVGEKSFNQTCTIKTNPLYPEEDDTYAAYDKMMREMTATFNTMHETVNQFSRIRKEMEVAIERIPEGNVNLRQEGKEIIERMEKWDEEMVQRKSKAYDDVENFPNKLSANYLFLINQTESDIPRVNQPSVDRKQELDKEWQVFEKEAATILNADLPMFNKKLWEAGVGAVYVPSDRP